MIFINAVAGSDLGSRVFIPAFVIGLVIVIGIVAFTLFTGKSRGDEDSTPSTTGTIEDAPFPTASLMSSQFPSYSLPAVTTAISERTTTRFTGNQINELRDQKFRRPDLQVIFAVGGDSVPRTVFDSLTSSDMGAFAAAALRFVQSHSYDGLVVHMDDPRHITENFTTPFAMTMKRTFDSVGLFFAMVVSWNSDFYLNFRLDTLIQGGVGVVLFTSGGLVPENLTFVNCPDPTNSSVATHTSQHYYLEKIRQLYSNSYEEIVEKSFLTYAFRGFKMELMDVNHNDYGKPIDPKMTTIVTYAEFFLWYHHYDALTYSTNV